MLWCASQAHGFVDARRATYRQWAQLGAQVRRQERGSLVLFYRDLPSRAATEAMRSQADEPDTPACFVARASDVFNAMQVDNAPAPSSLASTGARSDALAAFDSFVAATGAVIEEGGSKACYIPSIDTIRLPVRTAFISAAAHAATLSHELVHRTGAQHRLARGLSGRFGTNAYAAEELVAELGAAFVLAELGLARQPHPDHARYLAGWL